MDGVVAICTARARRTITARNAISDIADKGQRLKERWRHDE